MEHVHHQPVLPDTPFPGLVEFDATTMAAAVLDVATQALADEGGPVQAVGIANQRASTVLWERATGKPVGPGIGWQDLRTVGTCLELQADGFRLAPNASATKLAALLDLADPDRSRSVRGELCFGTVDTWVAWTLSGGTLHVTDTTNAGITGLIHPDATGWDPAILAALRIPAAILPTIVHSTGVIGEATALSGAPVIAGIAGDQQASLFGQGCTRPGLAKATFGTGGMLDQCVGTARPSFSHRGGGGTFPIITWSSADALVWGVEAVMLSAGSCVEWLRDDLGIIDTAAGVGRGGRRLRGHRRCLVRPCPVRAGRPGLGLRGPGHLPRDHPGYGTTGDGPSRLGRRGRSGCGPAVRSRDRLRPAHREPASGRGHVGQRRVHPGPGRLLRTAHRGLPGTRSHHPGRRLSGRHGRGHLGRRERRGRGMVAPASGGTGPHRGGTGARRERWLRARERSQATIPELSALDF